MAMIFVGGSRDIFELPEPAVARIGAIVAAEHGVLIGDAPGPTPRPSLLAGYGYEHVGVFHAGKEPRAISATGRPIAYRRPAALRVSFMQRRTARWPGVPTSA
jgi:hypothetical protein